MTETQLRFQAGVPRAGYGPPSPELGSRGDFYYDLTRFDFYGPKRDSWGEPVPIVGPIGETGPAGEPGSDGSDGSPGQSAYQLAVANGYSGTQQQWLASLEGDPGDDAYEVAVANGFSGIRSEWLASLKGEPGPVGPATTYRNTKVGLDLTWVSGTSINVSPGLAYVPYAGGLVELTSPKTIAPGMYFMPSSPSPNTFYYVYIAPPGDIAVSTTPPAAYYGQAKIQAGQDRRRYIGALLTSSDGSRFLRFMRLGDEVRYIEDVDSGNTGIPHRLRVLKFAPAEAPAVRTRILVSVANAAPVGASAVLLNISASNVGNLWLDYNVQGKSAYQGFQQLPGGFTYASVRLMLDESRQFVYSITSTPTSSNTNFDVLGYQESLT